jgi:cobalt-zinc-cadmium efflux system outer membrane protein
MPYILGSGAFARRTAAGVALLALAGCASVPADPALLNLQSAIGNRVPSAADVPRGDAEITAAAARVDDLLRAPLDLETAVRIGLLNSPRLRATYADLNIAHADVVAAGLISNPTLDVRVRPTFNPATLANLEFGIVQGFIDLLMRPARKRMANAAFAETRLRLSGEIVAFAADVRDAYFAYQAALNAQQILADIAESTRASADLAARFHDAGNISDLRWKEETTAAEDAALALIGHEADIADAREALAALLGLGERGDWSIPEILPAPPLQDEAIADLEKTARDRRLDVAEARQALQAALVTLETKADWRLWKDLGIGVGAERDADGQWSVGPEFQLALPIFDQGKPEVARAAFAVQKAQSNVKAAEVRARTDVRRAHARLTTARKRLDRYAAVVLPLKRDIVALKQQEYNYMFIGAFELLLAKKAETTAYLDYIEAVHGYWHARAQLDRALGGGSIAAPSFVAPSFVVGGAP